MIDELTIYGRKNSVFKSIIAQIPAITTYYVSPNYGHDLNTNNLQIFIKDPASGLKDLGLDKYPIAVCVTPRSAPTKINGYRWEQFFFSIYFLERTGYLPASNDIRDLDQDTNLTMDEPPDSWGRMKIAAITFLDLLAIALKGSFTMGDDVMSFRNVMVAQFDKASIRRLSNFNVDKLSGVELQFSAFVSIAECEVAFDGQLTLRQFITEVDPVWNTEKTNYFTKSQVLELIPDLDSVTATKSIEVDVIAGEAIGNPRVVMISNGEAFLFDPADENNIYKQVGVSRTSANPGDIITVVLDGSFNTGGNVIQDSVYFAGSGGLLTTNQPNSGILVNVGLAKDNDYLIVKPSTPYIAGAAEVVDGGYF